MKYRCIFRPIKNKGSRVHYLLFRGEVAAVKLAADAIIKVLYILIRPYTISKPPESLIL